MRKRGIEGTKPKELVIGRRYHVEGFGPGANYVLSSIICDGTLAVLRYPKSKKHPVCVPVGKLRNTYRYKENK